MESIINAIYDGTVNEKDRYKKPKDLSKDKEFAAYEKLTATMTDEQKCLLEDFLEAQTIKIGEKNREIYSRAFKLGLKVGIETAQYDPSDW